MVERTVWFQRLQRVGAMPRMEPAVPDRRSLDVSGRALGAHPSRAVAMDAAASGSIPDPGPDGPVMFIVETDGADRVRRPWPLTLPVSLAGRSPKRAAETDPPPQCLGGSLARPVSKRRPGAGHQAALAA